MPLTRLGIAAAFLAATALPVLAAGDIAKGEKDFGKCKACHSIYDGDTPIQKGAQVGPNLFGIVGRPAASLEGFSYGPGIQAAAAKGLVWDEDNLIEYVKDPSAFLTEFTGEREVSKMTFKMKKPENVVAYLASLGGDAAAAEAGEEAEKSGN